MKKTPRGFVLLYVVIVVATVMVGMALAASLGSTFAGNRIRAVYEQAQLRAFAMKCADIVLLQVRNDVTLVTSSTYTIGTVGSANYASCAYSVSGTSPSKTITITATQYDLYKRITIITTQVSPTISATWTETL